ncbi:MAG: hypothetical protein LBJ02_04540 [Bifidobacteriaceae bacterium]|jgi:hypothetical protein|nr:hypothetical protein [Bifidobacteriaceae bacterium]
MIEQTPANTARHRRAARPAAGIAAYSALFALAAVILAQSPLAPWSNALPGTDSGNFLYEGHRVLTGHTPYLDFFDHKGPLIFLINAAGDWLAGRVGVWLIEWICLGASAVICARALAPLVGRWAATAAGGWLIIACGAYLESGNLTEEYALPLGMAACAVFIRFARTGVLRWHGAAVLGLTCGAALMLRPTAIALWAVYCLAIALSMVIGRRIREVLAATGWFVAGLVVVTAPVVAWLAARGALGACFEQMFLFNAEYASRLGPRAGVKVALHFMGGFDFMLATGVTAAVLAWVWSRRQTGVVRNGTGITGWWHGIGQRGAAGARTPRGATTGPAGRPLRQGMLLLASANLIAIPLLFLLIVLPGRAYGHYMMQLLPCYALPFGLVCYGIACLVRRAGVKALATAGLAALTVTAGGLYPDLRTSADRALETVGASPDTVFAEMVQEIKANTEPGQTIQVYANQSWVYLATERDAATRYHYLPFSGGGSPEMRREVLDLMEAAKPQVIVDVSGVLAATDFDLSGYREAFSTGSRARNRYDVYVRVKDTTGAGTAKR